MRSSRFYHDDLPLPFFLPPFPPAAWARNRELHSAAGTAGTQQRAPDRSGNCRTSTASSRSVALPHLNRELQITGRCRTSTASSRLRWALRPQQWLQEDVGIAPICSLAKCHEAPGAHVFGPVGVQSESRATQSGEVFKFVGNLFLCLRTFWGQPEDTNNVGP